MSFRDQGGSGSGPVLVLLDGGQRAEVALDARRELLALGPGRQEPEIRLAPGALAAPPGIQSEPSGEPRPFGANEDGDGAGEQQHEQPAHGE